MPTGEIFPSLSAAGRFVLDSKSCDAWKFWSAKTDHGERRLAELRTEGLLAGLFDRGEG